MRMHGRKKITTMAEKKITVVYSFYGRVGKPGIASIAYNQLKYLANQPLKIVVTAPSIFKKLPDAISAIETMKIGFFKIPLKNILGFDVRCIHDLITASYLLINRNKIDLIHCWPGPNLITLKMARLLKIPSVIERPNSHTVSAINVVKKEYEKLGIEPDKKNTHMNASKRVKKEIASFAIADYLLCPSSFVYNSHLKMGDPESKLIQYQYGYDDTFFKQSPVVAEKHHQGLKLIYVGSVDPRKGLHYGLEAWFKSTAYETGTFTIVGKFEEKYRNYLDKYLHDKRVNIIGFSDRVHELMKECDALLLPTIEEGSALVTYEAQACGCALLVSNASGAICEHRTHGLIHNVGDVEEITTHINIINSDKDFLVKLKMNALKNARGLSWMYSANKLSEIYFDIFKKKELGSKKKMQVVKMNCNLGHLNA